MSFFHSLLTEAFGLIWLVQFNPFSFLPWNRKEHIMNNYKIEKIKSTPIYRMLRYNYEQLESRFLLEASLSKQATHLYEDMMDAEWRMNVYLFEQYIVS